MSAPGKAVHWNIKVSKETDRDVRAFLVSRGRKRGDLSKFVEEAVRWRLFHQTVREARAGFADVPPDELQKIIDDAVADVRTKRHRHRAKRPESGEQRKDK
jgi:Ribbon-helix-helix domain